MTVSTTLSRIVYLGDGATTTFSFPFPGVDPGDIQVFFIDIFGAITEIVSNFVVTLNPPVDPNPTGIGGTVTYPVTGSPIGVGTSLAIVRNLPDVQGTSLSNQGILYPTVIELALDYLTMLIQDTNDLFGRAFVVPPSDPAPAPVPSVNQRANQLAVFDASGNLTAGALPPPGTFISAAMQPVVQATTLALARTAMGLGSAAVLNLNTVVLTGLHTIGITEGGTTFILTGGAYYTITFQAASLYAPPFYISLFNNDTRGKLIDIPGNDPFILWPGQELSVALLPSTDWAFSQPGRWKPTVGQTLYVDPVNGLDSNDGLGIGVGNSLLTIQMAVNIVKDQIDSGGLFTVIQLLDGAHQAGDGIFVIYALASTEYDITGNVSTPSSVTVTPNPGQTCFSVQEPTTLNLANMKLNGSGSGSLGVNIRQFATVDINNVIFSSFVSGVCLSLTNKSSVGFTGPVTFSGNYVSGIIVNTQSFLSATTHPITMQAGTFTTFLTVADQSNVDGGAPVTDPGVIGKKFEVDSLSILHSNGTIWPGTIAGTTDATSITTP